jgi:hypothetical protein
MTNFDEDALDLLGDDGDGTVEMAILEEEQKCKRSAKNTNSGCSVAFLIIGSSFVIAGWYMIQML